MTLVEFILGMTIGLLVTLAATGSIVITCNSARSMTDSITLEQQANLLMVQIGQQIIQAGAVNAYLSGTNPDDGVYSGGAAPVSLSGAKITFDTRDIGVDEKNPGKTVFGEAGDDKKSDTLSISYAQPNDNGGIPAYNCIGGVNDKLPPNSNRASRVVNVFKVEMDATAKTKSLKCGNDQSLAPIASNVMDMRIQYLLLVDDPADPASRNLRYQTADAITRDDTWHNVVGMQICLHMQGDLTQAPEQGYTNQKDCRGNDLTKFTDGKVHRFVRQTFYLRNAR